MANNKDEDIVVLYSDKIDDMLTCGSTASNSWSGTFSAANITAATSNWTGNNNYSYGGSTLFSSSENSGLEVSGDANFKGDIKLKGRSLDKTLKAIEDRLAILVPDPEKLEHFETLKKAYEHYKVLEALCQLPPKEEN